MSIDPFGQSPFVQRKRRSAVLVMTALVAMLSLVMFTQRPVLAACGGNTNVSSQAELDAAITAFNAAGAGCDFGVTQTADFTLISDPVVINNTDATSSFNYDGGGFTIDGDEFSPFLIDNSVASFDDLHLLDTWTGIYAYNNSDVVVINSTSVEASNAAILVDLSSFEATNFTATGIGDFEYAMRSFGSTVVLTDFVANNMGDSAIYISAGSSLLLVRAAIQGTNFETALVVVESTAVVRDSTFNANAEGVYVFAGELTLINSTITNSESGAVRVIDSDGTLINVTIAGNDEGVYAENFSLPERTLTIHNSILADNTGPDCDVYVDFDGVITIDIQHTLIEDIDSDACDLAAANPDGDGNIIGENPVLGVLANYGGPTQTIPLFSITAPFVLSSPAIDAGDDALALDQLGDPLEFDQRGTGFPRIVGSFVDMGAFEGVIELACPAFPVTAVDEAELNEAIFCYNLATVPGVYIITLGADIDLSASTIHIDNPIADISLVIEGDGFTIDGQGIPGVRPILVKADSNVTINNATITGGNLADLTQSSLGGGIANFGETTLNNVDVIGNQTENDGGGLFNEDGATMTINDSSISANHANFPNGDGGGISNDGTMTINRSAVNDNVVEGDNGVYAGGIVNEGVMTIIDSTVDGNSLTGEQDDIYGGGISNQANLTIINSSISNNTVEGTFFVQGGGIHSYADEEEVVEFGYGTQLTIINSTISGNSVTGEEEVQGGGIYATDYFFGCCFEIDEIPVTIINSTISDNSATATGDDPGIAVGGGVFFGTIDFEPELIRLNVTLHNSIFANSTTDGVSGGDCYLEEVDNVPFESLYNLYEDTDDGACGLPAANPDADGNIVGQDPNLGALANNGGPTFTHLPLGGSLAIDSGNNALALDPTNPLTADQRGFTPRIVNVTVDRGSVEVGAEGPAVGFCPVDPNVGTLLTDVLGTGQGSPTKGFRTRKLVVPNSDEVVALYGQLAAIDVGVMKYVRFLPQGYPKIQIHAPTSYAYRPYAISWWGSDIPADANYVKGQFFWGAKGNKSPRAFVLWPTYQTTEDYANVFEVFDESSENHVAWEPLYTPIQVQTLDIPETTSDGADINVSLALVDLNKDDRSVIVTVEAGGVSEERVLTVPNRGVLLNIEEFLLEDVPAGTDEITITLESPVPGIEFPAGGDSMAMIGAAANYACAAEPVR